MALGKKRQSWGEAHFPGRLKFKQFHSGCQRQHSIFSKIYKLLYSFQFDFSPFTRVSPLPHAHITMLQLAQLLKVLKIEASPVSINHSNTGTWAFCCCCWVFFLGGGRFWHVCTGSALKLALSGLRLLARLLFTSCAHLSPPHTGERSSSGFQAVVSTGRNLSGSLLSMTSP